MYEPVYLFIYPFHFYLSINLFVYLSFIQEAFRNGVSIKRVVILFFIRIS